MDLKERIIETALALFQQNGIKSMTMSDIAAETGISKRTLYEVFQNKEDLLEMCIIAHMEQMDKAMQAFIDNSEDVIDTMMRLYAQLLNDMRTVNKSVMHDLKKYHSQLYKMIECKQKESVYTLLPLLEKGVKQGLIREDVNFEIILWLVKSQFKALMDDNYFPTDKYSTNEFIQAIILNFIRGISTPLGNEKVDHIIVKLKKQSH
jgi:AcrR family transcriptional regulator